MIIDERSALIDVQSRSAIVLYMFAYVNSLWQLCIRIIFFLVKRKQIVVCAIASLVISTCYAMRAIPNINKIIMAAAFSVSPTPKNLRVMQIDHLTVSVSWTPSCYRTMIFYNITVSPPNITVTVVLGCPFTTFYELSPGPHLIRLISFSKSLLPSPAVEQTFLVGKVGLAYQ